MPQEIKYFKLRINLIIPLKNIKDKKQKYKQDDVVITQNCSPEPYSINLIEHDHLKLCKDVLIENASETIFIFDEVHKALGDTKRTSIALEISRISRQFIVLTGTLIIDNDTRKLLNWLKLIVSYEVNNNNFYVAANNMLAKTLLTGVKVNREEVIADFTNEQQYNKLVPPIFGGTNIKSTPQEWSDAVEICYEACNISMIHETKKYLQQDRGVFLVGKDSKHIEVLKQMILAAKIVDKNDIFVIDKSNSIYLTDEAVESGIIHDYKVVIAPIRKAEGYTLTRLSALVISVYPSNKATRTQILGSIDRVSQNRDEINITIVHIGLLSVILTNHNKTKNLEDT